MRPPLVFYFCCCTLCWGEIALVKDTVRTAWVRLCLRELGVYTFCTNLQLQRTPKTVGSLCLCLHFNVSKWHLPAPRGDSKTWCLGTRPEKCIFQSYAIGADTYVIVSALPSSSIRHNGNSNVWFFGYRFLTMKPPGCGKRKWNGITNDRIILWNQRKREHGAIEFLKALSHESWVNVRRSTRI